MQSFSESSDSKPSFLESQGTVEDYDMAVGGSQMDSFDSTQPTSHVKHIEKPEVAGSRLGESQVKMPERVLGPEVKKESKDYSTESDRQEDRQKARREEKAKDQQGTEKRAERRQSVQECRESFEETVTMKDAFKKSCGSVFNFFSRRVLEYKTNKIRKIFENGTLVRSNDIDFLEDADGVLMAYRYTGKSTKIIIPSYVDGYPVCFIHPNFFSSSVNPFNNHKLRGVIRSISEMDRDTYTTRDLRSSIRGVTEVQLPCELESIPPFLFSGCRQLKNLVIPEFVVSIAPNAFENSGIKTLSMFCPCPANFHLIQFPVGCSVYTCREHLKSYAGFIKARNRRGSLVYTKLVKR